MAVCLHKLLLNKNRKYDSAFTTYTGHAFVQDDGSEKCKMIGATFVRVTTAAKQSISICKKYLMIPNHICGWSK